jgi:toxin ParE1/3/4
MAAYSLSEKAVSDLDGIYEYTILNFGLEQARAYLLGLHERFQILADSPGVGRSAAQLAPELRRHEYQSHIIFYTPEAKGVLIVRVLHTRMDARRHLGETDEHRA